MTLRLTQPAQSVSRIYTDRALRAEAAENAAIMAIYSHPNPEALLCKLLARRLDNEARAMIKAFAEYDQARISERFDDAFSAADDMAKAACALCREAEEARK